MGLESSLDIVIVNWNSGNYLRRCLRSIAVANRTGFKLDRVVVIDNDSADGSANGLETAGLPLVVRRNNENGGFASACNQGAGGSRADYLLFLNPDTRLFDRSLSVPIRFMCSAMARDVGICGIQFVDAEGTVETSCARFPTLRMYVSRVLGMDKAFPMRFHGPLMREWNHEECRVVDQVSGAFFLVRRGVFEDLDGFDERFFVYLEDVDFSLRADRSGWRSYFLASTRAYHRGGGSSDQVKARRLCYYLTSRLVYSCKHFSRRDAFLLLLSTLFIEPMTQTAWVCWRGSAMDAREIVLGHAMFYARLPGLIKWFRAVV